MRLILLLPIILLFGCDFQKSQLDHVQRHGELIVLTRNSPTTYYQGPFGPTGLEYDLAKGFADFLGVKLRLITPDTLSDILDGIQSGKGDIAAAGLTITDERKRILNFGPSYQYITHNWSIVADVAHRKAWSSWAAAWKLSQKAATRKNYAVCNKPIPICRSRKTQSWKANNYYTWCGNR